MATAALLDRTRTIPTQVRFAAFGLVAIGIIIPTAAVLRSEATLDALEAAARPRSMRADSSPLVGTSPSGAALSGSDPRKIEPGARIASSEAPTTASHGAPEGAHPGTHAQEAELTSARLKGLPALEQLAQRYPEDPAVLRALLAAYTKQRNPGAAIKIAEQLIDLDPKAADDRDVEQSLMLVVGGPPDPSAEALRVLSAKMGSRGPDLLYEITLAPKTPKLARDRASDLLRDPTVLSRATPELRVAIELRNLGPCARKALYARAAESGDARSLALLKPLTATTGCGILRRSDCFPCLEPRADLIETVNAIQKRIAQSSPPK